MRPKNQMPLKEALEAMIEELRLRNSLYETTVRLAWEELMGPSINQYTRKIVLHKRILYLTIDSAPLRQELQFAKSRMIELLNGRIGEKYIEEIVIRG